MEKFAVGLLLGGIGGMLIVANNYKVRALVKKGQDEVSEKFDKMLDEKLDGLELKTKKNHRNARKEQINKKSP